MKIVGLECISTDIGREGFFIKAVVNNSAAIFFPGTRQHREIKGHGVSYEDDYQGNALALTATKERIDIRFHRDFSDERVGRLIKLLLAQPQMEWARDHEVLYQGRRVDL